jgi:hypothetical protein
MNQACPPFSRAIAARDLVAGDHIKLPTSVGPTRAQEGVVRVARVWLFGQMSWINWDWGAYSGLSAAQIVFLFEGDD